MVACILLCIGILILSYSVTTELIADENRAREFIFAKDADNYIFCNDTNDDSGLTVNDFAWRNFTDYVLKRAFYLYWRRDAEIKQIRRIFLSNESERYFQVSGEMDEMYNKAETCVYPGITRRETGEKCKKITRYEINKKFSAVTSAEERKYYWVALHNYLGEMRKLYVEKMQLSRKMNMIQFLNIMWEDNYEEPMTWFREEMDRAWQEIFPLYKEIHTYIRRRLINVYGSDVISENGPIPSHHLGATTYDWWTIKDIALPYPEKNFDITKSLKNKNITILDMLKLAEDFYHSLGFPYIDDTIWNNTHTDSTKQCISKYKSNCKVQIIGMAVCLPVDELSLHTVIGAVFKFHYINQKRQSDWPNIINRQLPNEVFVAALEYVGELSSWTVDYLAQTGFIKDAPANNDEVMDYDINILMKAALKFLATMPYMYKVSKWHWDSDDSAASEENYNKKWWDYSLKYQGICPPVRRTENDFDPASSEYVDSNLQTIKDFVATICSFQFYKSACEVAGHKDLLHRCNLYAKMTFGDTIRTMFDFGKILSWQQGIYLMTSNGTFSMDTKPLLEYFQPLYEWLKKKNEHEYKGWESKDPMVCPK